MRNDYQSLTVPWGDVHTITFYNGTLGQSGPTTNVGSVMTNHKEIVDLLILGCGVAGSVAALEAANERILQQQKQLIKEERLKALLQMAGATAHEMNQPLMALLGNIELLQHKNSTPERRAIHLKRIAEAGARLSAIVSKIQTLHHDEVRPYPGGLAIVDLHREDADPKDQKTG